MEDKTIQYSRWIFLLLVFLLFKGVTLTFAQPSLMADDTRDVTITYNGEVQTYTLIRDAFKKTQWYYVPKQPRLTEVLVSGEKLPELTLMRYQFPSSTSTSGMNEGALLIFSVSLSPEPEAMVLLKAKWMEELSTMSVPMSADLALSALPLKKATAVVYKPSASGDSLRRISEVFGSGVYPIYATQKAPFALRLDRWDADLNDALIGHSVSSISGIPIVVTFTFQGVTPPAHLKIRANYRSIHRHYSSDKALAAKASYYGLFGASSQIRWTSISESLKQDGGLEVEKIGSEDIDSKTMDEVMQGVLKRINDNVFQALSPPPTVPPATADMPTVTDYFGGAGYNATLKNVEQIAELTDHFEWNERKIVDRETAAGGLIGIGKYSVEIRNRAVQFVPPFKWQVAHFILPDISDIQYASRVTVNTVLLNKDVAVESRSAIWTSKNGWKTATGNVDVTTFDFPIASYTNNGSTPNDLKFQSIINVEQNGRISQVKNEIPAFEGSLPVPPPLEVFTTITFDPSDLIFKAIENSANLSRVSLTMRADNKTFSTVVQPKFVNGKFQFPSSVSWVIPTSATDKPIKVSFRFDYAAGITPAHRDLTINDLLKDNNNQPNYYIRDPAIVQ